MGNRISVQFKNGKDKSVVLFSHWGGIEFYNTARDYVKDLKKVVKKNNASNPIDRLEPETMMVDFIRYITKDMERVDSDLYLSPDEHQGDNSDQGHFIIDVNKP